MKRERWFLIIFVILFLMVFLREVVVGFLTDWWWFTAVGFEGVFTKTLLSRIALFGIFGLFFLIFFYGNLWAAARRGGKRWMEFYSNLQLPMATLERFRKILMIAVAVLIAMGLGAWASERWMTVLQALNAQEFGVPDPIFGKDVGFYVFTLPLLIFLKNWGLWTLAVTAASVVILYWESKALGWAYQKVYVSPRVRLHLIFLASLLFLLLAWHFQLRIYNLLYSQRGVVFGASYTDINAELVAYRIMMGLSVVLFGAMVYGLWRKQATIPLIASGGYVAALVLVTAIYPAAIQQFVVEPNEVTKERPYIEHAIKYTRYGFGLDQVGEHDFPALLNLTSDDLETSAGTFQNIRLWDWRPLRQTYSQLQEMRLYYRFLNPDVDRYMINGESRQVLLAPREMDTNRLSTQAQTWVNRHLKYTHGYGVAMSPVNEVTEEGMPVFFLKDIPPQSEVGLEITRPELYYGELTSDYALVGTTEDEFDYPLGETNAATRYEGTGGVPIGSLWRRAMYAMKYGQLKMLTSQYPTAQTRLMENRQVVQRIQKIAPFLSYDRDPYMVVADSRLFWILDAFTVSGRMPYSEPSGGINYIRNSVKVVLDAYNGSVTYYLAEPDPITTALGQIFPDLFHPFEEMPASIREHIRYPLSLFEAQATKWQSFHMEDPEVFYNQEDLWARPTEIYQGSEIPMEAYYVVLSLFEPSKPEFLLMLPYTPTGKDNMVAWLAARADPEHYGELVLFKFSKQELIYGPMQIEARIDQETSISEQLTLWSQQGSSVIRGNLLVIPVRESLIYAEPLYLRAERSDLPELKRVLLSYGPRVIMAENLQQGLNQLLGGEIPITVAETSPQEGVTIARPGEAALTLPIEQASRALALYQEAQAHLRAGEWAAYGEAMSRLEALLVDLERRLRGGGG
jgi:uncharacterized membrane protein (UPF0182 family)